MNPNLKSAFDAMISMGDYEGAKRQLKAYANAAADNADLEFIAYANEELKKIDEGQTNN